MTGRPVTLNGDAASEAEPVAHQEATQTEDLE